MNLFERVCAETVSAPAPPASKQAWLSRTPLRVQRGETRSPENVAVARITALAGGLRTKFIQATSGDSGAAQKIRHDAGAIKDAASLLAKIKTFREAKNQQDNLVEILGWLKKRRQQRSEREKRAESAKLLRQAGMSEPKAAVHAARIAKEPEGSAKEMGQIRGAYREIFAKRKKAGQAGREITAKKKCPPPKFKMVFGTCRRVSEDTESPYLMALKSLRNEGASVIRLADIASRTNGMTDEGILATAKALKDLQQEGRIAFNIQTGYTLKEEA